MATESPEYSLLYWPGIPGRGEYIRLALEEAGASYTDTPGGVQEVLTAISPTSDHGAENTPPLAPPLLRHGNLLLSQTANILLYLGPRLGLVPEEEEGRVRVNGLVLTALDLSDEAHNTHHPVGTGLYYEQQKEEAVRCAGQFRDERIPKFFNYFEHVLEKNGGGWMVGEKLTYADLVVWQVVDGIRFAFPKASWRVLEKMPLLRAHYEAVKKRENVKRYLESGRRQVYSMGIFRNYEELDE